MTSINPKTVGGVAIGECSECGHKVCEHVCAIVSRLCERETWVCTVCFRAYRYRDTDLSKILPRCPECGKSLTTKHAFDSMELDAKIESLTAERDIEADLAERFRCALYDIADGDAQKWPGCSARRVAAIALGRDEADINRTVSEE